MLRRIGPPVFLKLRKRERSHCVSMHLLHYYPIIIRNNLHMLKNGAFLAVTIRIRKPCPNQIAVRAACDPVPLATPYRLRPPRAACQQQTVSFRLQSCNITITNCIYSIIPVGVTYCHGQINNIYDILMYEATLPLSLSCRKKLSREVLFSC